MCGPRDVEEAGCWPEAYAYIYVYLCILITILLIYTYKYIFYMRIYLLT